MIRFRYKAVDVKGQSSTGQLEAETLTHLADALKARGLFLVEGRQEAPPAPAPGPPVPPAVAAPAPAPAPQAGGSERLARPTDAVSLRDVAVFTTEFAIIVRTAVPILESLDSLASQQRDPVFRSVLRDVYKSVQRGQKLSESFARFPKVFNDVYVSLIAAGEASGNLSAMLDRIVQYLNFHRALKAKVRSALVYPLIVVATAFLVVTFLVLYILPTFAEVFAQFNGELPLPTRILLGISAHIRHWWCLYLVGGSIAGGYLSRWLSDRSNAKQIDTLQLDVPLAGTLVRNIVMTRVLRTLSSLVAGGVPILKSLELAQAAAGNAVFRDLLGQVQKSAAEGRGLASAFATSPYFPAQVTSMIANAEHTGSLPEVLLKVADFYESETDVALKDFFSALEPIFVLFLGLLVGAIAVAILMPIFQLGQSIG